VTPAELLAVVRDDPEFAVEILTEAIADNERLALLTPVDVTDLAEARLLLQELAVLAGPRIDKALGARLRRLLEDK
jgi:hypothetical protein